jgi:hypothetical protein
MGVTSPLAQSVDRQPCGNKTVVFLAWPCTVRCKQHASRRRHGIDRAPQIITQRGKTVAEFGGKLAQTFGNRCIACGVHLVPGRCARCKIEGEMNEKSVDRTECGGDRVDSCGGKWCRTIRDVVAEAVFHAELSVAPCGSRIPVDPTDQLVGCKRRATREVDRNHSVVRRGHGSDRFRPTRRRRRRSS